MGRGTPRRLRNQALARAARRRLVAFAFAATAPRAFAAADIVHYPLTISLPPTSKPRVVTLHDLLHLDLPELVPQHVRLFRRFAYDRAARRVDRVKAAHAGVSSPARPRRGRPRTGARGALDFFEQVLRTRIDTSANGTSTHFGLANAATSPRAYISDPPI